MTPENKSGPLEILSDIYHQAVTEIFRTRASEQASDPFGGEVVKYRVIEFSDECAAMALDRVREYGDKTTNGPNRRKIDRIESQIRYVAELTVRDARFGEVFDRLIREREAMVRGAEVASSTQRRAKEFLESRLTTS